MYFTEDKQKQKQKQKNNGYSTLSSGHLVDVDDFGTYKTLLNKINCCVVVCSLCCFIPLV